jgi:group I intron endonuclease
MLMTGVYQWRNVPNGKVYVGSASVSLRQRRKCHRGLLNTGRHPNRHLQRAWVKYGEAAFAFEVLELCPPDQCVPREQVWMDTLRAADQRFGYNLAAVAGSNRGMKLSAEHRARLSAANTGRRMPEHVRELLVSLNTGAKRSEESRRRMSEAHVGKKMSPETRAKMSAAHKGKVRSAEHCRRLSEVQEGRVFTEEHRRKLSEAAERRCARAAAERQGRLSGPPE